MRHVTKTLFALLGLATALSACAPRYDGFDCEMVNQTPSGAQCTDRGIVVAQGEALVFRLSARSDSRQEFEGAEIVLSSDDPQIAEIRAGLATEQTVIGLTLGETTATLRIDGAVEDEVPIRVVPFRPSAGHD